jgi:hypothetical protein
MLRGFLPCVFMLSLGIGLGYWALGPAVDTWLTESLPQLIYFSGLSLLVTLPGCGLILLQGGSLSDIEKPSRKTIQDELGSLLVLLIIFLGVNLLAGFEMAFLLKTSRILVLAGGVGTLDFGLLLLASVLADLLWRH